MVSTARTTERRKPSARAARSSKSAAPAPRAPTHEEIALLAHELFVRSGCEPGRELEFWLEAERQLQR
jgi:hypothetical protein